MGTTYKITEIGPVKYNEETKEYEPDEDKDWYLAEAEGEEGTEIENKTEENSGGSSGEVNKKDKRIAVGVVGEATQYKVKYINTFKQFALPETGGIGTILYTMAGGIIVLFGAGFLYKKKFRERRG